MKRFMLTAAIAIVVMGVGAAVRATNGQEPDTAMSRAVVTCQFEEARTDGFLLIWGLLDEGHSITFTGIDSIDADGYSMSYLQPVFGCLSDELGLPDWVGHHRTAIGDAGSVSVGEYTITWNAFGDENHLTAYMIYDSTVGGGQR